MKKMPIRTIRMKNLVTVSSANVSGKKNNDMCVKLEDKQFLGKSYEFFGTTHDVVELSDLVQQMVPDEFVFPHLDFLKAFICDDLS